MRGGSWLHLLGYLPDQRQGLVGAWRGGEDVVHGLLAAAQIVVFFHVEVTRLAFDVDDRPGAGLELEDGHRPVQPGVGAQLVGHHQQGDVGQLAAR